MKLREDRENVAFLLSKVYLGPHLRLLYLFWQGSRREACSVASGNKICLGIASLRLSQLCVI